MTLTCIILNWQQHHYLLLQLSFIFAGSCGFIFFFPQQNSFVMLAFTAELSRSCLQQMNKICESVILYSYLYCQSTKFCNSLKRGSIELVPQNKALMWWCRNNTVSVYFQLSNIFFKTCGKWPYNNIVQNDTFFFFAGILFVNFDFFPLREMGYFQTSSPGLWLIYSNR